MGFYITRSDYIAFTLYTIFLGGALGGIWILRRFTSKERTWGLLLLIESTVAAILLTLMSTKYWFTGGAGIIDIGIGTLIGIVASVLIPSGLGIVVVIGAAYLTKIISRKLQPAVGFLLPCLLIPVIFSISVMELIQIKERNKPILPNPAHDIEIAKGFKIEVFVKEPLVNPTSIAFGPDSDLYVANYNGDIWAFSTQDGANRRYATGFHVPVGMAWHEDALYVASHGKISVLRDENRDGTADETKDIVKGLPARLHPWHANNGIVFGPNGRMYFAVGSTTDAAPETHTYAATILSVEPDGSDLRIFATGVRNPYRLAFNNAGDLFATDNGPDALQTTPGDELNHIVEGADYGFPKFFGLPSPNSGTEPPVALFPPHASADGLVFYHGDQFPAEYYDNAFVTLWHLGQIYRVELTKDENGDYFSRLSVFVTGLLNPLDITTGPDGCLYIVDFGASAVYKITYTDAD